MSPIEMQKGKMRLKGWPRRNFTNQQLIRFEKYPRKKNWHRNINKAIPKLMKPPFFRSLMSWRYGTSRALWNAGLRPAFLDRLAGGRYENSARA